LNQENLSDIFLIGFGTMNELYIKTKSEWRKWLSKNYKKSAGVWLVFYKKGTGKITIDYNDTVEEALCFGWIDSLVKKIDEKKYVRKFTPRNSKSVWSELNKKRILKLNKEGRITKAGLQKIEAAKQNGSWNKRLKDVEISYDVPADFITALIKNKKAKENFDEIPPSYKKRFYMWINIAKKKETKEKRITEAIKLLNKNKDLGLR
jgi:uncharacterized protein YdeI (YjbR/CyaY-like superfamily)